MKRILLLFFILGTTFPGLAQVGIRAGTAGAPESLRPEFAFQLSGSFPMRNGAPETTIVATSVRRFPERAVMIEGWQQVPVKQDSHRWEAVAAAGAMVSSGILAALLKDRANREFAKYNSTLNPAALDASRRLDRQSAAVFVVTQVSFAVLSYLLLSE